MNIYKTLEETSTLCKFPISDGVKHFQCILQWVFPWHGLQSHYQVEHVIPPKVLSSLITWTKRHFLHVQTEVKGSHTDTQYHLNVSMKLALFPHFNELFQGSKSVDNRSRILTLCPWSCLSRYEIAPPFNMC